MTIPSSFLPVTTGRLSMAEAILSFSYSAKPFKSEWGWGKASLREGGIRVPMIASWPKKIKAGSKSDLICAFWDIMPTFCEIAKVECPTTDGISFLPELLGKKQNKHDFLYWEFPDSGGQKAVRMGKWKGIVLNIFKGNRKIQLYDLDSDPREQTDVARYHPEIVKRMEDIMKQMLKIELERAFKSAGLKVSLLIGIVISALHFFQKVLPTALDPLHFYKTGNLETVANVNNMWMAMGEGWHYTLYVRLIPLLAVVPYAVTYYTDYKKGIVKNYYTRTKKINYISAKYIAVFLTGGTAAVAPLVLDLIATSAVMPSFIAISHTVPCNGNGIWSYILFSHPYIYYCYIYSPVICAGLMATMSLVVSLYVNNAFIVLLFPSVLCEFINAVSTWIPVKYRYIKGAAPWRLFRIDQVAINYWQSYVIFICVVLLFDLVIYVWRGVKNDAL